MKFLFVTHFILIWQISQSECYTEEKIDAIEKLILDSKKQASEYVSPKDSRAFEPKLKTPPEDLEEFDFIVVGSGSTGSVVGSRLSEIPDWKILVLEAGDFGNNLTAITRMSYVSYIKSDYNWGYYSIPQSTSCLGFEENRCAHPRGKGVGGTSLLNALIYNRGNAKDFNIWCSRGNPGWCYKDLLPLFLKQEDYHHTDPDAPVDPKYHGTGGLLRVEYPMPRHPQTKVFFKANEEMGYKILDLNGREQIGAMPFQINTKKGIRQDSGTAFLTPFLNRTNLTVKTKSLVTKILINENKEAQGVLFSHGGKHYRAIAKKEVIVCGGAINSPQLLMLSGIGPKDHLKQLGIPVVQDLQVGLSFSDHIQIYGITFNSNLTQPTVPLREAIKQFEDGVGPLAEALPSQGIGCYQSPLGKIPDYPDIELSFSEGNEENAGLSGFQKWRNEVVEAMSGSSTQSSFSIFVTPLHTVSLGTVRLKSSDPYDFPILDPKVLSDRRGRDIELTYQGIQLALKMAQTKAFQSINATLAIKPLKYCNQYKFLTKNYWYCLIRYISAHNNHPVSTCKMGPDPKKGAVVDAQLKVYGVNRLRVADASIIPLSTSSHINSICYIIGEKLANILKSKYNC